MNVRDRLIVAVVSAIVVVGAVWLLLVSPERDKAASLSSQIVAEQTALSDAKGSLASARSAAAGYPADVRALANVITAVPTSVDEPTVITTITKLAGTKVDVNEIDATSGDASSAGTTPAPSTGSSNALNLSFTFKTTYPRLQQFLMGLDKLTQTDGTNISSTGRLFTVSAISFTPNPPAGIEAAVTAQSYSQNLGTTGASGATTTTAAVTP
jgi:hypothetical protein